MNYEIDERDAIASSWPQSIDDSEACNDWAWKPAYDLASLVKEMLENIKINSTQ
jgi:nucleoside-diphosphate-sugar epimerase